jgi:2-polyprenyl-6-methoxyphenol hydroxylase-like FAD-dependent oxidoreductase
MMAASRTAIVGAGPTGLYCAVALARRGHDVTVIDRDAGPAPGGPWERKGVMQFHHPHGFRKQACDALLANMPDVLDALLAAGAERITVPELGSLLLGLRCRRMTFERVLRDAAGAEDGITFRTGHVDQVTAERGRVTGVRAGGHHVRAGLVIDASGRAGRITGQLRSEPEGGDCGFAYVSRQYQLLPGAGPGPVNSPIGMVAHYPGYLAIVFPHELGTLSALILRASTDRDLAALRTEPAFDAAARAIPALAAWTQPGRSEPISAVLPGGGLRNTYCGQLNRAGRVAIDGLIFAGDAVCTTNPAGGRRVATSLMQAQQLAMLFDEHSADLTSCSLAFDQWCATNIRPWFTDHVYQDSQLLRRWAGEDVSLIQPLPSDLICAAADMAPELRKVTGPYQAMMTLPASLAAAEPRARDVYASGWRPPVPDGPAHAELADIIRRACQPASRPASAPAPASALRRCPAHAYAQPAR